jgi:predicted DCC family thiol-disulfide oxidoreductase YuxK
MSIDIDLRGDEQEMSDVSATETTAIVLFNGVCHLCSSAVHFIIRRDPRARFKFAPLQSPIGQALLHRHRLSTDMFDTFVEIEGGRAYTRSTAALRVARRLRGLWPVACLGLVVPEPVRDAIYRVIAQHRSTWFGQRAECLLPTPEVKERFLQAEGASEHHAEPDRQAAGALSPKCSGGG